MAKERVCLAYVPWQVTTQFTANQVQAIPAVSILLVSAISTDQIYALAQMLTHGCTGILAWLIEKGYEVRYPTMR